MAATFTNITQTEMEEFLFPQGFVPMGLAGVALGGGHMDLFATISQLDCYAEGSVGAYIIGSRQPDKSVAPD